MAVYVLLAFDKDDDAHDFVKETILTGHVFGMGGVTECEVPATVRGVWKKPTLFCQCNKGKKDRSWTRGKKYGWWVCTTCSKPAQAWAKGDAWYTALGTNLLPKSETCSEYRPFGWESPAEWSDLKGLLDAVHQRNAQAS